MTTTRDPTVTVTQFTDPMCTWCWGSEPILRRLRTAYGDHLQFRFVMGGLIEEFETFHDAANDISEPGDVAPHWLEASERHGMPVETAIFETDPVLSTYPASVAFVAARTQDRTLGHRYLRRLREAYATEVRNVNRREEQVRIAEAVGLDVDAITTVGTPWRLNVIYALRDGELRFNELKRATDARSKTLSEALEELVETDVVSRRMEEDAPVAVYYGLTEKGDELPDVLDEFDAWAQRWGEEVPAGPNPRLRDG